MAADKGKPETDASGKRTIPAIHWNDEAMQTAYANICNVATTREEVSLFFGTNESWQVGAKPIEVKLNQRILITPHTAKRLLLLLDNTLKQYEGRFGAIELEHVDVSAASGSGGSGGNGAAKS